MVIIYQEQEIIKHFKHIHALATKFNGEKKKRKSIIPLACVCSSNERIF